MGMSNINISKALKFRKRLAEQVSMIDEQLKASNSVIAGNDREDMEKLMARRKQIVESLIALKSALSKANVDIQDKIFRISELKGLIALLNGLDTTSGKTEGGWRQESVEKVAFWKKSDIQKMVLEYQSEIDKLQDELEVFNTQHTVSFDASILQWVS